MFSIRRHVGNQCCNVESNDHWPLKKWTNKVPGILMIVLVMVMMMNSEVGFGPTGDTTCFRLSWPGSIFHLIISIRWFPLRFLSLRIFVFCLLGFDLSFCVFCISNPLSWSDSINYPPSHYFHQMDSSQMCWLFSTLILTVLVGSFGSDILAELLLSSFLPLSVQPSDQSIKIDWLVDKLIIALSGGRLWAAFFSPLIRSDPGRGQNRLIFGFNHSQRCGNLNTW